jgi:hypothetical protein
MVQWVKPMSKEHSHDVGPDSSYPSSPALYFGDVPNVGLSIAPFIWIMNFLIMLVQRRDNNFKNPFGLGQMLIPTHTITPWNTYFIPMNSLLVLITIM